jgi:hypothetical protein
VDNTDIFYSFSGFKNNHFNLKILITNYRKLPPTKKVYKEARNRYHVHSFTNNNNCGYFKYRLWNTLYVLFFVGRLLRHVSVQHLQAICIWFYKIIIPATDPLFWGLITLLYYTLFCRTVFGYNSVYLVKW